MACLVVPSSQMTSSRKSLISRYRNALFKIDELVHYKCKKSVALIVSVRTARKSFS